MFRRSQTFIFTCFCSIRVCLWGVRAVTIRSAQLSNTSTRLHSGTVTTKGGQTDGFLSLCPSALKRTHTHNPNPTRSGGGMSSPAFPAPLRNAGPRRSCRGRGGAAAGRSGCRDSGGAAPRTGPWHRSAPRRLSRDKCRHQGDERRLPQGPGGRQQAGPYRPVAMETGPPRPFSVWHNST